jgi:hypothetical protein
MSWHFWIWPLLFFWFFGFSRRWGRPWGQRHSEDRFPSPDPELRIELENQRDYIGELEARVAELENRLDFTERLLSSRHEAASTAT